MGSNPEGYEKCGQVRLEFQSLLSRDATESQDGSAELLWGFAFQSLLSRDEMQSMYICRRTGRGGFNPFSAGMRCKICHRITPTTFVSFQSLLSRVRKQCADNVREMFRIMVKFQSLLSRDEMQSAPNVSGPPPP